MSESEFQYWVAEIGTTILSQGDDKETLEEYNAFMHICKMTAKALGYKINGKD